MIRLLPAALRMRGTVPLLGLFAVSLVSPFRLGVVSGASMSPSFHTGSIYLMARNSFVRSPLQRGEVVVFDEGGTTYIKRVVATEGDQITLYKERGTPEAEVVRDWQLRLAKKAFRRPWERNVRLEDFRVPSGFCYVIGDNLNQSVDSRNFGPIPVTAIRGRVLFAPPPTKEGEHLCVNYTLRRS